MAHPQQLLRITIEIILVAARRTGGVARLTGGTSCSSRRKPGWLLLSVAVICVGIARAVQTGPVVVANGTVDARLSLALLGLVDAGNFARFLFYGWARLLGLPAWCLSCGA